MLLGSSYAWGNGAGNSGSERVWRDLDTTEYWFRRAASSNDPFIICMIGSYYQATQTAAADARAVLWFKQAAALGSTGALVDLGRVCREGQGSAKDLVKAINFFTRAAAKGNADAHGDLGEMYLKDEGHAADYALARKHLTVASGQGLPQAQF